MGLQLKVINMWTRIFAFANWHLKPKKERQLKLFHWKWRAKE